LDSKISYLIRQNINRSFMVLELIYSKTYTKFEFKNRKSKFLNYSKNYYKNFN